MLAIPSASQSKFEERLRNESIPQQLERWDWGTGLLGKRNTPGCMLIGQVLF